MISKVEIRFADGLAPGFHFLATVHHLIGVWDSLEILRIADVTIHPRILHLVTFAFTFITTWNLFLQIIYFILALIHDVVELKQNNPQTLEKLKYFKGYIFITLFFPYAIFVSVLFWIVYYIDRELVFAKILDIYVTRWLNHCVHTSIVVFLIIEILIARQKIPNIKDAFIGLSISAAVYTILVLMIYLISGQWVYPALEKLDGTKRTLLFIFNYISVLILMITGIAVQNYRNQIRPKSAKPKCS